MFHHRARFSRQAAALTCGHILQAISQSYIASDICAVSGILLGRIGLSADSVAVGVVLLSSKIIRQSTWKGVT